MWDYKAAALIGNMKPCNGSSSLSLTVCGLVQAEILAAKPRVKYEYKIKYTSD
jgi:hypothetical protein